MRSSNPRLLHQHRRPARRVHVYGASTSRRSALVRLGAASAPDQGGQDGDRSQAAPLPGYQVVRDKDRIDVAIDLMQSGHWLVRACSLTLLATLFALIIFSGAKRVGVTPSGQVVDSSGIYVR